MGVKLRWEESNSSEAGHRIYRSLTTIDPNSLPAPYADLGPNITEFIDDDVYNGDTYYYRISAYTVSGTELVSSEIVVNGTETGPAYAGLLAHYTMDNYSGVVLNDEIQLNPATMVNPVFVEGVRGQAFRSDGSNNNHILIDDETILNNATQFTVCFWVKLNSLAGDNDLCGKGSHAENEPFSLWLDSAAIETYAFLLTDSLGNYSGVFNTTYEPPLSVYEHIAISFTAGGSVRFYVNGVEDTSSPFSVSTLTDIAPIGPNGFSGKFIIGNSTKLVASADADFDMFRIYNVALTQAQIQDIYNWEKVT